MRMKTYKQYQIIFTKLLIIGIITIVPMCYSCTGSYCDGTQCKKKLGLKNKPSVNDSIFYEKYSLKATRFNVFVESSASMDGYVKGNTNFKTTLHRLIGQVVADVLKDDRSISLNYINTQIKKQRVTPKQFTQDLSPTSFRNAGGSRANSDIIEIISNVVKSTKSGEISMFVSDCVYSPESSDDIDKALKKQQTDMLNILKNKAKTDKDFGVVVYRFTSDFHGYYYNKTDAEIMVNGVRPYFVWFMGDKSVLANVCKSISDIVKEENAYFVAGISEYNYIPYRTIASDHSYHYLSAKSNDNSLFTFSFRADLSRLPLSKDYLLDKGNYVMGKDKYFIKKIEAIDPSDSKNKGCNYKYTICIKGRKNLIITPTTVEISIKSMLSEVPQWVKSFDDPNGNDYNSGYDAKKIRTFGLSSLIEGIADFYKESYYATFRIQIN